MSLSSLVITVFLAALVCAVKRDRECMDCVENWIFRQPMLEVRFTRSELCELCRKRNRWINAASSMQLASSSDEQSTNNEETPGQKAYLEILGGCQGMQCLDLLPTEYRHPSKRCEYRAMSDEARQHFHEALRNLKRDTIDGISKYDLLVNLHHPNRAPGAHGGPAFLPFHREYIKMMEMALRLIDPRVAMPYFDSSMDDPLPSARDSVIWTADFLGTTNGPVVIGPFANWSALDLYSSNAHEMGNLERRVEDHHGGYEHNDVETFLTYTSFENFDLCHDALFDGTHGGLHGYIGGHMARVSVSPSDPAFFLHHAFVDFMWDAVRQKQTPAQREMYAENIPGCTNEHHQADSRMEPFGIRNIDGLSNTYSDLVKYDPRPICAANMLNYEPPSEYLFCDPRNKRCLSKIQPGGVCDGFEGFSACFRAACIDGKCV